MIVFALNRHAQSVLVVVLFGTLSELRKPCPIGSLYVSCCTVGVGNFALANVPNSSARIFA